MEQQSTPDTSGGQGQVDQAPSQAPAQTPDVGLGQGQTDPRQGIDQNQVQDTQSSPEFREQFEKQSLHFNQKITEMGQTNAQLQQELAQLRQRDQNLGGLIAQHYGFESPQQDQDVIGQLIDNPQMLSELIKEQAQKEVEPIKQQLAQKEASEYLQSQLVEKESLRQELGQYMDPAMIEQVLDITTLVNPKIVQLNQQLTDPTLNNEERSRLETGLKLEMAKEIRNQGGINRLVRTRIGETVTGDFGGFVKSAAQVHQQQQMQTRRAGVMNQMTGGAGMHSSQAQSNGGVSVRSESVFR